MNTFKTVEWEHNDIGDKNCSEFVKSSKKKGKSIKTIDKNDKKKQQKKKKKLKELALKGQIDKNVQRNLIKRSPKKTKNTKKSSLSSSPIKNEEKVAPTTVKIKQGEPKKQNSVNEMDNYKSKTKIEINFKHRKSNKIKQKLQETITKSPENPPLKHTEKKRKYKERPLRERMMMKLKSARFRYLNEQIYSNDGNEAQKIFAQDPESFTAYHEGYRQQVEMWPMNPLDIIISSIKKMPKSRIIGDFGCGEAKLSESVTQEVHSFDLVAANDRVTACNMAHVPLANSSVDVAVFCLSLMGTNLQEYLCEANRVLKNGGTLKIAEVESRFDNVQEFIEGVERFNFKLIWKDLSHNLFYFMDFQKETNIKNKKKLPTISLHPCLYKKR